MEMCADERPRAEKNSRGIKLWLPDSLYDALLDLAAIDDRSLSEYIRCVLSDHALGRLHHISRGRLDGRRDEGR